MQTLPPDTLTQEVVDRFSDTPDPRLREILGALVRHLHAFARETRLTEAEWFEGIRFLSDTGQACTATRQEFILLSDVLGLSMQTVAQQAERPAGCTEATVFGPFFVPDAPQVAFGGDVARGAQGQPCVVSGSVRGPDGEAIVQATLEVWQADDEGLYDVQKPDLDQAQARGVLHTREDGRYEFRTVVAQAYPIPTDGPVGRLLQASRRSPWRPAHLHFRISAEGYETLITHVFKRGDPHLASDPVFGVRPSLVADWRPQPDGTTRLDFDFVLARRGRPGASA